MLMVVAGLVARTVINLEELELGFEPAGVLSMRIDLPETQYAGTEEVRPFFQDMTEQVEGLPAVDGVALVSNRPATESGPIVSFEIEGRPVLDEPDRVLAVLGELRPMSRVGPVPLAEVTKAFPDLLGDMELAVQKVTVNGKEYHRMQD